MTDKKSELRPGRYRHYKGRDYDVIGVARHSETEEPMVVYFHGGREYPTPRNPWWCTAACTATTAYGYDHWRCFRKRWKSLARTFPGLPTWLTTTRKHDF